MYLIRNRKLYFQISLTLKVSLNNYMFLNTKRKGYLKSQYLYIFSVRFYLLFGRIKFIRCLFLSIIHAV